MTAFIISLKGKICTRKTSLITPLFIEVHVQAISAREQAQQYTVTRTSSTLSKDKKQIARNEVLFDNLHI